MVTRCGCTCMAAVGWLQLSLHAIHMGHQQSARAGGLGDTLYQHRRWQTGQLLCPLCRHDRAARAAAATQRNMTDRVILQVGVCFGCNLAKLESVQCVFAWPMYVMAGVLCMLSPSYMRGAANVPAWC